MGVKGGPKTFDTNIYIMANIIVHEDPGGEKKGEGTNSGHHGQTVADAAISGVPHGHTW